MYWSIDNISNYDFENDIVNEYNIYLLNIILKIKLSDSRCLYKIHIFINVIRKMYTK